ncbi:hypothetical protein ACFL6S_30570 [Candidatus Poribacteria bacterium]
MSRPVEVLRNIAKAEGKSIEGQPEVDSGVSERTLPCKWKR